MIGLAVQNFLSAAVGMAVLIAFIYGFSRKSATTIGNFWVLLIRSVMILIPFCVIISLVLVSQGTVQSFSGPVTIPLLDPVRDTTGALITTQSIPRDLLHLRLPSSCLEQMGVVFSIPTQLIPSRTPRHSQISLRSWLFLSSPLRSAIPSAN